MLLCKTKSLRRLYTGRDQFKPVFEVVFLLLGYNIVCFSGVIIEHYAANTAVSPCSSRLGTVLPGGTSATQRQKLHTDNVNQCLLNKIRSHEVPNVTLFDFMFFLIDYILGTLTVLF